MGMLVYELQVGPHVHVVHWFYDPNISLGDDGKIFTEFLHVTWLEFGEELHFKWWGPWLAVDNDDFQPIVHPNVPTHYILHHKDGIYIVSWHGIFYLNLLSRFFHEEIIFCLNCARGYASTFVYTSSTPCYNHPFYKKEHCLYPSSVSLRKLTKACAPEVENPTKRLPRDWQCLRWQR